jgi:hypothetical protein
LDLNPAVVFFTDYSPNYIDISTSLGHNGDEKEAIPMGDPAQYVQFWFITISVANLLVIGLLIVVFAIAVALRRPGAPEGSTIELPTAAADGTDASLGVQQ